MSDRAPDRLACRASRGPRRRLCVLALGCLGLLAGCEAHMRPTEDAVKITKNSADVAGCRLMRELDPIRADTPGDAKFEAENQATGMGGNTILDLTRNSAAIGIERGLVYRCDEPPKER